MTTNDSDFDVAKKIHDVLATLPDERKHRILRWVAESLNISLHVKQIADTANPPLNESSITGGQPQVDDVGRAINHVGASVDVKSYVESKSPKNDVQYAAVVAYYYRFEAPIGERSETITTDMLQNSTRLAGRARLKNPGTTLNNAKTLGYLDGVGRGQFRINTVGENLVAMTLPSDGRERAPRKAVPKKSKSAKKNVTKKRS